MAYVRHRATISAFSSSPQCIPSSIGSPRSAASRTLFADVHATTTSGPPAPSINSSVLGTTGTSRNRKRSPSADTRGSRSHRSSRSSDSGKSRSYAWRPDPKTSRSTQGPPRPTPSENRPPESRCSSAACSPRATGCVFGNTLTAVPTRMRRVRPRSSPASVTADGQVPYGTKWCSASQTESSPDSSPTSAVRTARCSASPGPGPGTGRPVQKLQLASPSASLRLTRLPLLALTSDTCHGHGRHRSCCDCPLTAPCGCHRLTPCRHGSGGAARTLEGNSAVCPVRCHVSPRRNRPRGGEPRPTTPVRRRTGTAAFSGPSPGRARSGRSGRSPARAPRESGTGAPAATRRSPPVCRTWWRGPSTAAWTTGGTGTRRAGTRRTAAPRGCSGPATRRSSEPGRCRA